MRKQRAFQKNCCKRQSRRFRLRGSFTRGKKGLPFHCWHCSRMASIGRRGAAAQPIRTDTLDRGPVASRPDDPEKGGRETLLGKWPGALPPGRRSFPRAAKKVVSSSHGLSAARRRGRTRLRAGCTARAALPGGGTAVLDLWGGSGRALPVCSIPEPAGGADTKKHLPAGAGRCSFFTVVKRFSVRSQRLQ